jgi:Mn2+/Fe2+ NRAMP family transporter
MKIDKNFIKSLGPGLLWAGAAVGVSHLVQSTRAGANYGFYLAWFIIVANLIKYPFFEFAPRYATATGETLIDGYRKTGKWAVGLYGFLTFATMFTIQAAVTIVTAGLIKNILHVDWDITLISAVLLFGTLILLWIGKYAVLDKFIKIIIITLTLSTIIAVISAYYHPVRNPEVSLRFFDWTKAVDIAFLIALAGWMPAPIDVSVWHSYWSVEKQRLTGYKPQLKESLLDFKIGYIGTAFLALGFLSLGALLMYGSGENFSNSGSVFAGQLIGLYTKSIGQWAYLIIAIAAFTTMFSTTLTCLDAYSKVLKPTTNYLFPIQDKWQNKLTVFWLIIVVLGALMLISVFSSAMKTMVDIATTLSFVTAPVLAYLNYKAVTDTHFPKKYRPGKILTLYAQTGIVLLSLFSLFYIFWKLGLISF